MPRPLPTRRVARRCIYLLAFLAAKPQSGLINQMNHRTVVIRRGHGDRHGFYRQPVAHRRQGAIKIRAGPIQLVDEKQRRQAESGALPPDGFGLRLHPAHPVQHDHAAIQHPHRAFDFDGEIHVARRINQLNPILAPRQLSHGGGDGDAVHLLLDLVIHVRRAFMHFADFVGSAGVVQHPLGQGSFASVYVGGDADVAHARQVWGLGHGFTH